MAKVGHIEVEVRPTVTLESAAACVMMLNLFLDGNEDYDLVCVNRGDGFKWELTDEPKPDLSKTVASIKRQRDIEQMNNLEIAQLNAERANFRKPAEQEDE